MISRELEQLLHVAFVEARKLRHRVIGTEHLLYRLVGDPRIDEWLKSKLVDTVVLKTTLEERLRRVETFATDQEVDTQPTREFQRTIQRAILRVMSSDAESEANNLDLLHALLNSRKALPAELGLSHMDGSDVPSSR